MYAIVKTGGKQYRVSEGDVIDIEKVDAQPGDTIELPVLMVGSGRSAKLGDAALGGLTAKAKVIDHHKDAKKLVFKFHKRKRYRRLRGHRQPLTKVEIVSLEA